MHQRTPARAGPHRAAAMLVGAVAGPSPHRLRTRSPAATRPRASTPTSSGPDRAESPSGEITIWDRSGDLFKVFDAVDRGLQREVPRHHGQPRGGRHRRQAAEHADHRHRRAGRRLPRRRARSPASPTTCGTSTTCSSPTSATSPQQKVAVNSLDGGIYGVPFDLDPGLLYYNATALEAAGVDATAIETYDDLLEAARAATRPPCRTSGPIHLEQSPFLGQLQLEMYASQLGTSLGRRERRAAAGLARSTSRSSPSSTPCSKEGLGTRAEYLEPDRHRDARVRPAGLLPLGDLVQLRPAAAAARDHGRLARDAAARVGGRRRAQRRHGRLVVRPPEGRRELRARMAVLRVPHVRRGRLHRGLGPERRLPGRAEHLDPELPAGGRPDDAALRTGRGARRPGPVGGRDDGGRGDPRRRHRSPPGGPARSTTSATTSSACWTAT